MSKELQLLNSKIQFYKRLINVYDEMNFITKSNRFDNKIKEYQDNLAEVYKNYQRLMKENEQWKNK